MFETAPDPARQEHDIQRYNNPAFKAVINAANGGDTADNDNCDESITYVCPDCGAPMIIIETFQRVQLPRAPPAVSVGEP